MHASTPEEKTGTGERRRLTHIRASHRRRQLRTRDPQTPGRPGVVVVETTMRCCMRAI